MTVEIRLPTLLRVHASGSATVSAESGTVGTAFAEMTDLYPGLSGQLVDSSGTLHRFVNVYVNDDDIRYLESLDTPIADGDVVSILPAVAGG